MSYIATPPRRRPKRRPSLSLRVSLWLMAAAIVPLLITLAYSELLSRPALIAQANLAMETDAQTRVQLIDTYFTERLLDAETLSQVPTVQQFLATPPQLETTDLITHATYALVAGEFRDKRYSVWTLFDPKGNPRLYYPPTTTPQQHGATFIPPTQLQVISQGKPLISPVYFDPKTKQATVDIYAPISLGNSHQLLGFIRATLKLDYIWNIVNSDSGANGDGSYAFLLDENGVRIADVNTNLLFTSIAPLSAPVQQEINSEARFGSSSGTVLAREDSTRLHLQQNSTFQMTPTGRGETFQVAQHAASVVPWTYVVLSPVSTVTAVADHLLLTSAIVTFTVLLLAAIVGLGLGQVITRPILRAVERLRNNSVALKTLSTKQQSAATEQNWVIDSSQVGLQSVQYYTEATRSAARLLHESGLALVQNWDQHDAQSMQHILSQMIGAAQYIEKAVHYQTASNQKLSTAIKVTTQVNEQLIDGATSASSAASELEQVVNELQQVVGR